MIKTVYQITPTQNKLLEEREKHGSHYNLTVTGFVMWLVSLVLSLFLCFI